MFFARSLRPGVDGPETRVLAAADPARGWVDVRRAERARHEAAGADPEAAARIAAAITPASMAAAIAGGEAFLAAARAAIESGPEEAAVADPDLAGALDPAAYRDFMIFEEHFSFAYKRLGQPVPDVLYELPVSYQGNPASFIGPGEEVPWPAYSRRLDYEVELGIVIGRGGADLAPETAADHIFGFTILNDFSARDIQFREMEGRLGPCKGKHFACGVGPWIATPDEIDWRGGLRMRARVNGETTCDADSAEAIWGLDEVVAWASQGERLVPGTLLGSGTCNGGSTIEIGRELAPGDEVELEIEGLGILRNRLGQPAEDGWSPPHRRRPAVD